MKEITKDQQTLCIIKCPKFNQCNAPICPLDPEWNKRKHISGDKCCVYLLESSKADSDIVFEGAALGDMFKAIEVILISSATIKRTYLRAAKTASRLHPEFRSK